ncbi:hypothetical protein BK123_01575 [Paenibacillus lautus]|uniref:Uncharacterized protein n=1 Tax=Paenibacillus lautus TaxID=1401 RepID=A0A1R1B8E1_PAELA|nr:hypothetical protein BK123_01575 [Paenibacillus lautus]
MTINCAYLVYLLSSFCPEAPWDTAGKKKTSSKVKISMRLMPLMMSDHLFSFSPIYMQLFANVDGNVHKPKNRTSCFQREI